MYIHPLRNFSALAILSLLVIACNPSPEEVQVEQPEERIMDVPPPPERYGIPEDAYKIYDGVIGRNEFLADILLKYDVSYGEISELETVSKDVYDVRKLRAGDSYAVFCSRDSVEKAHYFVVETSASDYVVYNLSDSLSASLGQKPKEYRVREAAGEINSSLYQTIADNDLSPELAMKLNDIYAWTVDFYRIQKGDYFKAVFEEIFVDGERIGVGKIIAAEFGHRDEVFESYRFEGGDVANYFDEKGESLRKAFLKAPLKFSRISSRYSLKRYHPVQKRWKAHLGTDYAAPNGTPIMATGDGTVIQSAYSKYNGNYVKIRHNSTYTTQYLHMSKRAVKNNDFVRQGEVIGYVGATGLATGPHVCYRFWKNGKQVDPYRQDLPPSEPVAKKLMPEFMQVKDSLENVLREIPDPGKPA